MSQLQQIKQPEAPAFTPDQERLIRDTIAKNATPDEFKLFLYRAKAMHLDPLKPGQIHFVKYGNNPGSVVVGIEGFRSIAHKTGRLSGIKRGSIKDDQGRLVGAWAEVFRSDWAHPAREEVPLEEYQGTSPIWRKMPETMIKKCAEAAALRMAFPNDLGGVYEEAEMEQAKFSGAVTPAAYGQPTEIDGVLDSKYVIPFGTYVKRSLEEVVSKHGKKTLEELILSTEEILAGTKSTRMVLTDERKDEMRELIKRGEEYLVSLENPPADDIVDAEFTDSVDFGAEQSKPLSRAEIGSAIMKERTRLGLKNADIQALTSELFKKKPGELSDSQMAEMLETLSRRQS